MLQQLLSLANNVLSAEVVRTRYPEYKTHGSDCYKILKLTPC